MFVANERIYPEVRSRRGMGEYVPSLIRVRKKFHSPSVFTPVLHIAQKCTDMQHYKYGKYIMFWAPPAFGVSVTPPPKKIKSWLSTCYNHF